MMKKKLLFLLLVPILVASLLFGACAAPAPEAPAAGPAPVAPTPTPTPAPAEKVWELKMAAIG